MSLLIRGGIVVTMNDRFDIVEGDVSIADGRIAAIGPDVAGRHERVIEARGAYVLPGLIQTHIHLCQTLFRGYADDLALMDWLRTRVWPMEAAHTPATLRAAARLATTELLASGTTTVLTMETVHDTDVVFEAVAESGLRATIGKCMMDFDAQVPKRLQEDTRSSLDESVAIRARWHGAEHGRLHAAFAPRFAVSCSRELLEAVASLSGAHNALVHTHASESHDEIAIVRKISGGMTNLEYLASAHLASPRLCAAHCVWVDDRELLLLAAVLQAMRQQPGVLPARDVLGMATRAGARTLGLEDEIGSLEVGKRADLIVVDRDRPHLAPGPDPYSTLVYAARGSDVRTTIVDGEVLVENFLPVRVDRAEVAAEARTAARALATSAGLTGAGFKNA